MASKGPTNLGGKEIEQFRRCYGIPVSCPVEDALAPEFWAHVSQHLRPFDRLELMAEDRTYVADLIVISAGRGYAKVKLLAMHELAENAEALDAEEAADVDMIVKWGGPAGKWMVIRQKDKMKMRDGLATREDAQMFVMNYRRVTA